MARKTRRSGRAPANRRVKTSRSKLVKFRFPKAFRLTPVELKAPIKKHAHVLGLAGLPPCPAGSTFVGKVDIGGALYCKYQLADGTFQFITCE